MRLEGIHHITAITGDAQRNVDFYVETLGLRLVKKTVNYDQPDVYHLYYGDEVGAPGSIMTFFEFPGAAPGRHSGGMIHTVVWRVPSAASLDFWAARLEAAGRPVTRHARRMLESTDPEGLGIALLVDDATSDRPLTATAPGIPGEHALTGFHGVRAYATDPARSLTLLEALGFERGPYAGTWAARGDQRHSVLSYDAPPADGGIPGAGTIHHIAWASRDEDHERWRSVAGDAGARVTPIIDRTYFRSIYFREPSGVLFEIATLSPGFAVDEPADSLGRSLVLPPQYEPRRADIERVLTPVTSPC
ncbi:MAG: VOC family protein [Actinomycetota bacterium]|nr:VOC family protein [Actinomycetota bacterium]